MKGSRKGIEEKKQGFTLIELLIVVAIIAILAAIAVPNFLEAQTRAKNARVKADMRTIATAMETYTVDYNRPPIGYFELRVWHGPYPPFYMGLGQELGQFRAWQPVTTPVAYLTSVPRSPWQMQEFVDQNRLAPRWYESDKLYLFEYTASSTPYTGEWEGGLARYKVPRAKGITWVCRSLGPARRWVWQDRDGNWCNCSELLIASGLPGGPPVGGAARGHWGWSDGVYDPTNGTTSHGWFVRSNKGMVPQ